MIGLHHSELRPEAWRRVVTAVIVMIALTLACLIAVFVKLVYDARQSAWNRAAEMVDSLVAAVASETERNIESFDLSLLGVRDNLDAPGLATIGPYLRQLVLFDRSATARHLEVIRVLDANGWTELDSTSPQPQRQNLAERSYFRYHKTNDFADLHIGQPFETMSGNLVLPLSRRLSDPDGKFAGVVVGLLRLTYFRDLFKSLMLERNDGISLLRTDGTILMRWPFNKDDIGRSIANSSQFKRFASLPRGRFETTSKSGIRRLMVFRRVGNLPLVVCMGRSVDAIYAQWWPYAITIGALIGVLSAISLGLTIYLVRFLKRRSDAVSALAVHATTDALTGVANRRAFDATLKQEWWKAVQAASPIALLMIDADLLKQYNDKNGHQAGDNVLRIIAAALIAGAPSAGALVARYGGDEFAVVLPGHSAEQALEIAQHILRSFKALCQGESVADVALSIGVVSMLPKFGELYSSLIAAADEALYRAKSLGRDRIELADGPMDPTRLLMWLAGSRAA